MSLEGADTDRRETTRKVPRKPKKEGSSSAKAEVDKLSSQLGAMSLDGGAIFGQDHRDTEVKVPKKDKKDKDKDEEAKVDKSDPTLKELQREYEELKALVDKEYEKRVREYAQGEQIGRIDNHLDKTNASLEEAEQNVQATISCGKALRQYLKKKLCCCCTTEASVPHHDVEFDKKHPKPLAFQYAALPQTKHDFAVEINRMSEYLKKEGKNEGDEFEDENAELKLAVGKSDDIKKKMEKTDTEARKVMKNT